MILNITGRVYATFYPVTETVRIPLEEAVKLEIEHYTEMTIIRLSGEEYYFEKGSLIYYTEEE